MGFNIEQYEMGGDNYSNASGCGLKHPFSKKRRAECEKNAVSTEKVTSDTALSKGAVCVKGLPVYHPYAYAITGQAKRTQNRMICKARKEAKIKDDVVPSNAVQDSPSTDYKAPLLESPLTDSSSNTGMYIGIGVGILAIGIVAIVLIKKRK